MAWEVLLPPSPNWYSSGVACQTATCYAYAAYNYVVLLDAADRRVLAVLLGHGNKVTCLAAACAAEGAATGDVILSGGRDKCVVAWSVRRRAVIRKRQKLDDEVVALAAVPLAQGLVVIACKNGALRSWRWDVGGQAAKGHALKSPATCMCAAPSVALLSPHAPPPVLAGCEDGSVVAIDPLTLAQLWRIDERGNALSDGPPSAPPSRSGEGGRGGEATRPGGRWGGDGGRGARGRGPRGPAGGAAPSGAAANGVQCMDFRVARPNRAVAGSLSAVLGAVPHRSADGDQGGVERSVSRADALQPAPSSPRSVIGDALHGVSPAGDSAEVSSRRMDDADGQPGGELGETIPPAGIFLAVSWRGAAVRVFAWLHTPPAAVSEADAGTAAPQTSCTAVGEGEAPDTELPTAPLTATAADDDARAPADARSPAPAHAALSAAPEESGVQDSVDAAVAGAPGEDSSTKHNAACTRPPILVCAPAFPRPTSGVAKSEVHNLWLPVRWLPRGESGSAGPGRSLAPGTDSLPGTCDGGRGVETDRGGPADEAGGAAQEAADGQESDALPARETSAGTSESAAGAAATAETADAASKPAAADSSSARVTQGQGPGATEGTTLQLLSGGYQGSLVLWSFDVDWQALASAAAAPRAANRRVVRDGAARADEPREESAAAAQSWMARDRPGRAGTGSSADATWGRAAPPVRASPPQEARSWKRSDQPPGVLRHRHQLLQHQGGHSRMLFTINLFAQHILRHATLLRQPPASAADCTVVTTSLDRSVITWRLRPSPVHATLKRACVWHGLGGSASAVHVQQPDGREYGVQPPARVFVACGDLTVRQLGILTAGTSDVPAGHAAAADGRGAAALGPPGVPEAIEEQPPAATDVEDVARVALPSRARVAHHKVWYSGIQAPVTAMDALAGVLAVGCGDGAVGFLATASTECRLHCVRQRHKGAVSRVAWVYAPGEIEGRSARGRRPRAAESNDSRGASVGGAQAESSAASAALSNPPVPEIAVDCLAPEHVALPELPVTRPHAELSTQQECLDGASAPIAGGVSNEPNEPAGDDHSSGVDVPPTRGDVAGSVRDMESGAGLPQEVEASPERQPSALALLSLGEDGRLLVWQQLPPLAELQAALRANAPASHATSALDAVAVLDVATLVPPAAADALTHVSAFAARAGTPVVAVGSADGRVSVLAWPPQLLTLAGSDAAPPAWFAVGTAHSHVASIAALAWCEPAGLGSDAAAGDAAAPQPQQPEAACARARDESSASNAEVALLASACTSGTVVLHSVCIGRAAGAPGPPDAGIQVLCVLFDARAPLHSLCWAANAGALLLCASAVSGALHVWEVPSVDKAMWGGPAAGGLSEATGQSRALDVVYLGSLAVNGGAATVVVPALIACERPTAGDAPKDAGGQPAPLSLGGSSCGEEPRCAREGGDASIDVNGGRPATSVSVDSEAQTTSAPPPGPLHPGAGTPPDGATTRSFLLAICADQTVRACSLDACVRGLRRPEPRTQQDDSAADGASAPAAPVAEPPVSQNDGAAQEASVRSSAPPADSQAVAEVIDASIERADGPPQPPSGEPPSAEPLTLVAGVDVPAVLPAEAAPVKPATAEAHSATATGPPARAKHKLVLLGARPLLNAHVDRALASYGLHRAAASADATVSDAALQGEPPELPGTLETPTSAARTISAYAATCAAHAADHSGHKASARRAAHAAALPLLWQGDVVSAVRAVLAADALTADFVAMAAGAGRPVWRAVTRAYAAQLEAEGEVHLAVGHLCAAELFEDAVAMYSRAGLHHEATLLAERHLPPDSPALAQQRSQLALHVQRQAEAGGGEALWGWAARVYAAAGDACRAVAAALRRGTPQALLEAAELLSRRPPAPQLPPVAQMAGRAALHFSGTRGGDLDSALRVCAADARVLAAVHAARAVGFALEGWIVAATAAVALANDATLAQGLHATAMAAAIADQALALVGEDARRAAASEAWGQSPAAASVASSLGSAMVVLSQTLQRVATGSVAAVWHALVSGDDRGGVPEAGAAFRADAPDLAAMQPTLQALALALRRLVLQALVAVSDPPVEPAAAADALRELLTMRAWHAALDSHARTALQPLAPMQEAAATLARQLLLSLCELGRDAEGSAARDDAPTMDVKAAWGQAVAHSFAAADALDGADGPTAAAAAASLGVSPAWPLFVQRGRSGTPSDGGWQGLGDLLWWGAVEGPAQRDEPAAVDAADARIRSRGGDRRSPAVQPVSHTDDDGAAQPPDVIVTASALQELEALFLSETRKQSAPAAEHASPPDCADSVGAKTQEGVAHPAPAAGPAARQTPRRSESLRSAAPAEPGPLASAAAEQSVRVVERGLTHDEVVKYQRFTQVVPPSQWRALREQLRHDAATRSGGTAEQLDTPELSDGQRPPQAAASDAACDSPRGESAGGADGAERTAMALPAEENGGIGAETDAQRRQWSVSVAWAAALTHHPVVASNGQLGGLRPEEVGPSESGGDGFGQYCSDTSHVDGQNTESEQSPVFGASSRLDSVAVGVTSAPASHGQGDAACVPEMQQSQPPVHPEDPDVVVGAWARALQTHPCAGGACGDRAREGNAQATRAV